MKKALQFTFVTLAALMCAMPGVASAKVARCVIDSSGERFVGPCRFAAGAGGSFYVEPVKPGRTILGATSISVQKQEDGTVFVRGLTSDGINSAWGEVVRSRRDRACWKGSDFQICVY